MFAFTVGLSTVKILVLSAVFSQISVMHWRYAVLRSLTLWCFNCSVIMTAEEKVIKALQLRGQTHFMCLPSCSRLPLCTDIVERLSADRDAEIGRQLFFEPCNPMSDFTWLGRPGVQLAAREDTSLQPLITLKYEVILI